MPPIASQSICNTPCSRVFITYNCHYFEDLPTEARLAVRHITRLKVLSLTWFFGGKEPTDNPYLPRVTSRLEDRPASLGGIAAIHR